MFLMVDDELSFINELKGMNPILVYKPSDMKKAVRDVLDSAFRYSGQGLFSTSKVVLTIEDQKRFTDMIMEQAKLLEDRTIPQSPRHSRTSDRKGGQGPVR